jgi:DNA-binding response OmpR family regulator
MKIKKEYIILIEDDKFQAKLFGKGIEKIAKELGFKSLILQDGEEILKLIKDEKNSLNITKEQIGLIILDLTLTLSDSEISGFYILKEIQKLQDKIPVIIQSADDIHTSVVKAMKLGAEDYFVKNGDEKEGKRIFDTIERIMNDRSL